ncbi:unnamed protein product [Oikopleura dioica]|uniref:Uncharacterized protein n=1 Tax=Oikopleura dioica TaxID=34765 RepID=E4XEM1_OIKDI|nr:unnamed protein product [Oikopleura dioica]CBY31130.1 unnamed protein product [Oikopleura dioica]
MGTKKRRKCLSWTISKLLNAQNYATRQTQFLPSTPRPASNSIFLTFDQHILSCHFYLKLILSENCLFLQKVRIIL